MPVKRIEEITWTMHLARGRLIGSHHAADCSLILYEVWHDGDAWQAAHASGARIGDGSLIECLDACQEDFTDGYQADIDAAGPIEVAH